MPSSRSSPPQASDRPQAGRRALRQRQVAIAGEPVNLSSTEGQNPVPVVIEEFPYLVKANPEIPSIIQQALRPFGHAKSATWTRLLLCGSALSVMGKLLSGTAPLHGRAGLELIIICGTEGRGHRPPDQRP
jgi:AAA+ ATPase superfamily predicted ATPase